MIWTSQGQPYGVMAYVDETTPHKMGGVDFPMGTLTTCQGKVTIQLYEGVDQESNRHVGNVDTTSRSSTEDLYRRAKRLVEEHVTERLKHARDRRKSC